MRPVSAHPEGDVHEEEFYQRGGPRDMRFPTPGDSAEEEIGELFSTFQWLVWGGRKDCVCCLACKPLRSSDSNNWHLLGKRF